MGLLAETTLPSWVGFIVLALAGLLWYLRTWRPYFKPAKDQQARMAARKEARLSRRRPE